MAGIILTAPRLHAEASSSIPVSEIPRVMISISVVPLTRARLWQG